MVATAGCEVTAGGRADCAVSTEGMPVTTPRELVWVRYEVKPLVYGTVVWVVVPLVEISTTWTTYVRRH